MLGCGCEYSFIHYLHSHPQKQIHAFTFVIVITSPLFGHMIPLLDFAKLLSEYHYVTYIVSASKLGILKQYVFTNKTETNITIQSRVEFIGLIDGINDDYEVSCTSIPIQAIPRQMYEPLLRLLFPKTTTMSLATHSITRSIDLIITDLFVMLPVWEGFKRNIPTYLFIPNTLSSFIRYINIIMNKIKNGKLESNFDRRITDTISLTKGLICNSIFELDEKYLKELRRQSLFGSNSDLIIHIKQWLDIHWKRANRSACVIYVAFGSWVSLEHKQLIEITNALKPYPFIWSLKNKSQAFILPLGIDTKQHLLLDWVPQRFILSHPAIRLFISHGGWNSLLESMLTAKPTLVWPFFADQTLNGYRLEYEFGMGRYILNTDLASGRKIVTKIRAQLKEKIQVQQEYSQALQQGHDAYLMEHDKKITRYIYS
ncbi:hypothetical protein I4U23_016377 [Adineta vaga]|nr:hypothetical protein I4U23_016377 [Adineta vaga]